MNLLVIGATGPLGRAIVSSALAAQHTVTALARNPLTANFPSAVRVSHGDVLNPNSLASAVQGQDAVISSLGSALSWSPVTLLSEGTRHLVDAMRQAGVRRLICITGIGAGDSKGHGGFLYDRIIQPLLLKEVYKDKDRQESVVRESGLDWTLVRPGQLSNGPATGVYRVITDLTGVTAGKISRADTADFTVGLLQEPRQLHQAILLTE